MPNAYRIRPEKTGFHSRREIQYDIVYLLCKPKILMNTIFEDRLREIRESRGLTQSDLAKKAGLQAAAISHFETGKRAPSFANLKLLSDALNISVDYLLGRIDHEQHGHGLAAAPRAQQLFRHAEKLTDESFQALEAMARVLKEKETRREEEP